MMTPNFPPPQAYTRDTLTQAYQWLQTQPDNIKKLATSADALVRIFLRAKRNGDSSLESLAPVSTEKFRTDLKNIAAELQQFSEPLGNSETQSNQTNYATQTNQANQTQSLNTNYSQVPESPLISIGNNIDFEDPEPVSKKSGYSQTPSANKSSKLGTELIESLDHKTQVLLKKAQERFNLSSEGEALRLLVVLGFEKLSQI